MQVLRLIATLWQQRTTDPKSTRDAVPLSLLSRRLARKQIASVFVKIASKPSSTESEAKS